MPDRLDEYWQLTLRFLKIAREMWPKILEERGKIEPAARRDLLIAAEAKRLAEKRDGPVIAAGSTGSMPATAELIATIAKLPHGAVVLPGLDTDLDAPSWKLIEGRRDLVDPVAPAVGHPQFAMAALLQRIGIVREEVRGPRHRAGTRPRAAGVGGAAAGRRHRPLAGAARASRTFAEHEERALAVALRGRSGECG